jgi:hypothetical protein
VVERLKALKLTLRNVPRDGEPANGACIFTGDPAVERVLVAHFDDSAVYPGWVEVEWSKPTGLALEAVVERLKALKLTLRNVPRDGEPANGACIFTGDPAVERVLVARAY